MCENWKWKTICKLNLLIKKLTISNKKNYQKKWDFSLRILQLFVWKMEMIYTLLHRIASKFSQTRSQTCVHMNLMVFHKYYEI